MLCCQGRRAIGVMRVGNLTQVRLTAFGIMTSQDLNIQYRLYCKRHVQEMHSGEFKSY